MKLPYIKVEYREEDTGAPGKMSPALIAGFGLHWAWVYLFMFNGQYLLFPESGSMQTLLSTTSGVAHAVTLLLYAVCLKQARVLFGTPQRIRRNRVIAACLMAVAAPLCVVANVLPVPQLAAAAFAAAGVLSGVGSAALLMSFGVSFSVCDLPTIAMCAALSVPVGAVTFAATVLVGTVSPIASSLMFLVLPFVELLCLNKCSATLVDKLEFAYLTMPVRTASFAGHIGVPSVVFGLLLGVLRTCALVGPFGNPFSSEDAVANMFGSAIFAASVFTCLALVLAMLTLRKSRYFAFRVLVPLIGALLALLCSSWGADVFFRCFALFSSYFMLEMCLWTMYADIAQNYRVSAFTVFGFGHGLLSAGSLVGFLALQPGGPLAAAVGDPAALTLIALVTLTLGVAVLPNGAEWRSTLIRGRFCPSLVDDIDELVQESGDAAAAPAPPAVSAEAGKAGGSAVAQAPTVEPDAVAEEAQGAAEKSGSAVARASASPSVAEAAAAPVPVPPTVQASAAFAALSPETQAQQLGRFKRKCAAVADTFLLSRKETEVLFLLAKGRNSAAIQEALYISAGTANTHMRHIYRKLDVHSQHDLIDLVESMDVE